YSFGRDYTLSMFPSESVTLICDIDSYFYTSDELPLKYTSSNTDIVTVNEDGTIVARAKGSAIISVNLEFEQNGKTTTYFVGSVDVTVKDPFNANSIYLLSYKGNGGRVVITDNRGITTIQSYAFSNYEYVEKDPDAGDVINDEDPFYLKQMYIGENTITSIVIPEGVTTIEAYAFAKLTALEEVKLPTTLTKIGVGAFLGCNKLTKINLENVQFINEHAFDSCYSLAGKPDFSSVVAIGAYAFAKTSISKLVLPETAQSLDSGAFFLCVNLTEVEFKAEQIKIGAGVFEQCKALNNVYINAVVISDYAFYGCTNLSNITLGKDVAVIGQNAFSITNITGFKVEEGNKTFWAGDPDDGENKGWLYKNIRVLNEDDEEVDAKVIALVPSRLPVAADDSVVIDLGDADWVESGAFTGNAYITK
ncbi:MAG: leucine-rich repeat domain-containing protein, partial [Clostridiales bacterium]|nr:leucine-rich repeat domain-containing protein [Clostridiales bacterium]